VSQENVEITWRINEAFNRGDWDSWSSLIDPEIVYYEGESYLDTPPVMGDAVGLSEQDAYADST